MMKWIGNATGAPRDDYEEKNRVSSYRGYLFKLRRSQNLLAPQWGKRWFSIEGHFLKWYRQENDLFSSGMIDLKYIRSITKLEPQQQPRPSSGNTTTTAAALSQPPQPFSFMISSDERNLILRATSQNEMNSWIRALHMHADIARGGKGTTVVSDFNSLPLNNGSFKLNASSSSSGNSNPGGMMSPNNSNSASGPSLSIKRNRGLRASMTLEQELDFTLKKLDELEKEVVVPSPAPINIHRGERGFYQSPDGNNNDEEYSKENNSHYNAPSSPAHYQHMTNKLLRNVASSGFTNSPFDESMESITDAIVRTPRSKVNKQQRQQQNQQVQRDLNRAESFNSIEDISLAVKPNRVKSMRRHNNNNNHMDNNWNRSNSNSYDDFDSHNGASKRQQVYYPVNKSNNNQQQQQSRFGYGRHSELAPISPASDGELSDEFDVTSRGASSPSNRQQQQRRTSTRSNTSSNNSQQNSRNQAIPNQSSHSQSSNQGPGNYKKLGSPKRGSNGGNVALLPGNTKKFNQHFAESNDSTEFVVENIPSIDRYEEEEIVTRNVGRHSLRGEQDIPFRKRDFVNAATVGGGGVRGSKEVESNGGVRNKIFGIKSAW